MSSHDKFFIGAEWVSPRSSRTIDVRNASTGEFIGSVPEGTEGDIDLAVAAARRAFDDPAGWAAWSPAERAAALERLAAELAARAQERAACLHADRIANESDYGLGGSVWTADLSRARSVIRRVRTGTMGINNYLPDPAGPWGGVKSSGLGRELGPDAIAAYQNLKTVYA
jgi:acyl-CoA reductase-like NAD-dependent aldehyde dehydrogenase